MEWRHCGLRFQGQILQILLSRRRRELAQKMRDMSFIGFYICHRTAPKVVFRDLDKDIQSQIYQM